MDPHARCRQILRDRWPELAHGHRNGIDRFGGKPELADQVRCLYPYFYAPAEEAELVEQLRLDMAEG